MVLWCLTICEEVRQRTVELSILLDEARIGYAIGDHVGLNVLNIKWYIECALYCCLRVRWNYEED